MMHTTGIGTVALIITGIVVPTCTFLGWLIRRVERARTRRQQRTERFIRAQVENVAKLIQLKIDVQTGRIAQLEEHLADQDAGQSVIVWQMADVRERIARVEGQLRSRTDRG